MNLQEEVIGLIDDSAEDDFLTFALFDGDITLTGSYNWTRSEQRYNHENILITDSNKVLLEFNKEFELLWEEFPDLHI